MTASDIEAIHAEAHLWRARLASDDVIDSDRHDFAEWISGDPRHQAAFDEAQALWTAMADIEADNLPANAFKREWREHFTNLSLVSSAGAFAALLLIVGVTAFLQNRWILNTPAMLAYETTIGEIRTEKLADESAIILGAKSAVEVIFTNELRCSVPGSDGLDFC